jgi:hypothetical protein
VEAIKTEILRVAGDGSANAVHPNLTSTPTARFLDKACIVATQGRRRRRPLRWLVGKQVVWAFGLCLHGRHAPNVVSSGDPADFSGEADDER